MEFSDFFLGRLGSLVARFPKRVLESAEVVSTSWPDLFR